MSLIRLQKTYVLIILTQLFSLGYSSGSLIPDPCVYSVGNRYRCVHKKSCPQEFVTSICGPGGVGVCCLIISELSPQNCGIRQHLPNQNLNYKTLNDGNDEITAEPAPMKPTSAFKKVTIDSSPDVSSSRLSSTKQSSSVSAVTKLHSHSSPRHRLRSSMRTGSKVSGSRKRTKVTLKSGSAPVSSSKVSDPRKITKVTLTSSSTPIFSSIVSGPRKRTKVTLKSSSTPVSSSKVSPNLSSNFSTGSSLLTTLPFDSSHNPDVTLEEVTALEITTSFVSDLDSNSQRTSEPLTDSTELASEVDTNARTHPKSPEGLQKPLSTFEDITPESYSSFVSDADYNSKRTSESLKDSTDLASEVDTNTNTYPDSPDGFTQQSYSSTSNDITLAVCSSALEGSSQEPITIEDTRTSDDLSPESSSGTLSESDQNDNGSSYGSSTLHTTESNTESKKNRWVDHIRNEKSLKNIKRSAEIPSDDPDNQVTRTTYSQSSSSVTFSTVAVGDATPESVVIFVDESPQMEKDIFFNEREFELNMSTDFNKSVHELIRSLGEMEFICEYLPEAAEFLMEKNDIECPEQYYDEDSEITDYLELSETNIESDVKMKRSARHTETGKSKVLDVDLQSGKRKKIYIPIVVNISSKEDDSDNELSILGIESLKKEESEYQSLGAYRKSKNTSLPLLNLYFNKLEADDVSSSVNGISNENLAAEKKRELNSKRIMIRNGLELKQAVTKKSAEFYESNQSQVYDKLNISILLNPVENKEKHTEHSSNLQNFHHIPLKKKIDFLKEYDVYSGQNHFNNQFLREVNFPNETSPGASSLGELANYSTPSSNAMKDSVLFDYPPFSDVDSNEADGVLDELHENKISRLGKIAVNESLLQFIATGFGFRSFNSDTSDNNSIDFDDFESLLLSSEGETRSPEFDVPQANNLKYPSIDNELGEFGNASIPNQYKSLDLVDELGDNGNKFGNASISNQYQTSSPADELGDTDKEFGEFGNASIPNQYKSLTPFEESPTVSNVPDKQSESSTAESFKGNIFKTNQQVKVKIIHRYKQAFPKKKSKKVSEAYSYEKKNGYSKYSSKTWDNKYYNKSRNLNRRERNAFAWPEEVFRKREPQHIVGGWVEHQPWPWMVAIYDDSNNKFVCGGTLIDDLHILSAAHCFIKFSVTKKLSVVIGSLARLETQKGWDPPKRHRVRLIHMHEGFVPECYCNDIAILRLWQSVGSRHIPACLPERDPAGVGENTTIIGWGDTHYGGRKSKGTFHLNRLDDVTITDPEECRKIMSRIAHMTMPKAFVEYYICAGSQEGKDACSGDSGGPLMHEDYDGIWSVIGVVSFGFKCGEAGVPGTYSRISYYLPWIRSIIGSRRT